jgi:hypothetical protein
VSTHELPGALESLHARAALQDRHDRGQADGQVDREQPDGGQHKRHEALHDEAGYCNHDFHPPDSEQHAPNSREHSSNLAAQGMNQLPGGTRKGSCDQCMTVQLHDCATA